MIIKRKHRVKSKCDVCSDGWVSELAHEQKNAAECGDAFKVDDAVQKMCVTFECDVMPCRFNPITHKGSVWNSLKCSAYEWFEFLLLFLHMSDEHFSYPPGFFFTAALLYSVWLKFVRFLRRQWRRSSKYVLLCVNVKERQADRVTMKT